MFGPNEPWPAPALVAGSLRRGPVGQARPMYAGTICRFWPSRGPGGPLLRTGLSSPSTHASAPFLPQACPRLRPVQGGSSSPAPSPHPQPRGLSSLPLILGLPWMLRAPGPALHSVNVRCPSRAGPHRQPLLVSCKVRNQRLEDQGQLIEGAGTMLLGQSVAWKICQEVGVFLL